MFVGVVDAELFEGVLVKNFESEDVQDVDFLEIGIWGLWDWGLVCGVNRI